MFALGNFENELKANPPTHRTANHVQFNRLLSPGIN